MTEEMSRRSRAITQPGSSWGHFQVLARRSQRVATNIWKRRNVIVVIPLWTRRFNSRHRARHQADIPSVPRDFPLEFVIPGCNSDLILVWWHGTRRGCCDFVVYCFWLHSCSVPGRDLWWQFSWRCLRSNPDCLTISRLFRTGRAFDELV